MYSTVLRFHAFLHFTWKDLSNMVIVFFLVLSGTSLLELGLFHPNNPFIPHRYRLHDYVRSSMIFEAFKWITQMLVLRAPYYSSPSEELPPGKMFVIHRKLGPDYSYWGKIPQQCVLIFIMQVLYSFVQYIPNFFLIFWCKPNKMKGKSFLSFCSTLNSRPFIICFEKVSLRWHWQSQFF